MGSLRKLNARILALVLILVFTQKLGLGIWMHNWLHETGVSQGNVLHGTRVLKGQLLPDVEKLNANCHCIDDFLVPLVETPVITPTVPEREFYSLPCVYRSSFSAFTYSFASLRGPPAVAASC